MNQLIITYNTKVINLFDEINAELVGLNAEYNITVTSLVGLKVKELITDGGIVRLDLSDNNDGLLIIKIKDVNNTSNEYITKVIKVE